MTQIPAYVRINESHGLPNIRPYAPFRAVVILDTGYSSEWQWAVSCWLVESGCRYMSAWGANCSTWDDTVDLALIRKYNDGASDEGFIMTTWHSDESLEEVFWFAEHCALHPCLDLSTLLVDASEKDRREEMQQRYLAAQELPPAEDRR